MAKSEHFPFISVHTVVSNVTQSWIVCFKSPTQKFAINLWGNIDSLEILNPFLDVINCTLHKAAIGIHIYSRINFKNSLSKL